MRWMHVAEVEHTRLDEQMWRILHEHRVPLAAPRGEGVRLVLLLTAAIVPLLATGVWFSAYVVGLASR